MTEPAKPAEGAAPRRPEFVRVDSHTSVLAVPGGVLFRSVAYGPGPGAGAAVHQLFVSMPDLPPGCEVWLEWLKKLGAL